MRLYLDDDSTSAVFVRLLQNAGHLVLLPVAFRLSGAKDPEHLRRAMREQAGLLSHNYHDFELLHDCLWKGRAIMPGYW